MSSLFKKKCLPILLGIVFYGSAMGQNQSTTLPNLKQHITHLASDELAGRQPGTKGDSMAASYIQQQFLKAGLTLLGNQGYQPFDVVTRVEAGSGNWMMVDPDTLSMGANFMPLGFSANATVEAPVVFAGFGFDISSDSIHWDDYQGLDVKGKWVLAFRMDPELDNPKSRFATYSHDRYKVRTAADHGAAGLILVNTSDYDPKDELEKLRFDQSTTPATIPVIQVTRQTADKILSTAQTNTQTLQKKLLETKQPASQNLNIILKAATDIHPVRVATQNVLGLVKGKNDDHNHLVIGAHYDHLGMGGAGSRKPDTVAVHNGADDNASGVALMLELAGYFAKHQPQVDLLFIAFGAEEMGLVGSRQYTTHPLLDLKNSKAMLNLDMVGRLNETRTLSIGGTGTAKQLDSLIDAKSQNHRFEIRKNSEGTGPSDHASFYSEKIPVLFFSTGVHDQYHTPEDDVERINFEGLADITSFLIETIEALANGEQAITYSESGISQNAPARTRLKATLGIVPDMSTQAKGLRVDGVRPGGPAHRAGLQKGDIITAINGLAVENIYDYMYRLAKFEKGDRINLEIKRGEEKLIVITDL